MDSGAHELTFIVPCPPMAFTSVFGDTVTLSWLIATSLSSSGQERRDGGVGVVLDPVVVCGLEPEDVRAHLAHGVNRLLLTLGQIAAIEPCDVRAKVVVVIGEARNAEGETFSFERVRALVARMPDTKQAT